MKLWFYKQNKVQITMYFELREERSITTDG
jgi:hypothetical protein